MRLRRPGVRNYGCGVLSASLIEALLIVICLGSLLSGVVLAAMSMRDPARADFLERWSGICLILGLCLLGVGLRISR